MQAVNIADEMEIYHVKTVDIPVMFSSNILKSVKSTFTEGTAVRVIHEGRLGFSYSVGGEEPSRIAQRAVRISKYGEPAAFEFPTETAPTKVQIFDSTAANVDVATLVEQGAYLRDLVLQELPTLTCDIMVRKLLQRTVLENSHGFSGEFQKSLHGTAVKVASHKENMIEFTTSDMDCTGKTDFETLFTRVRDTMDFEQVHSIEPGIMPVILAPRAVSAFLEPLKLAVNGRALIQGISRLQAKVGAHIADDRITLVDDGTYPYLTGTLPFDGEGIPTQRTVLIEDGLLRNHIFDLQTAGQKETTSTGNGLRTFNTAPSPTLTNLIVKGGTTLLAKLIEEIDQGVLVENVMGTQQSNIFSGDMTLNIVFGRKIENGELTHAVKGSTIRANTFAALNAVLGVSSDRENIGNAVLPFVAFELLRIS